MAPIGKGRTPGAGPAAFGGRLDQPPRGDEATRSVRGAAGRSRAQISARRIATTVPIGGAAHPGQRAAGRRPVATGDSCPSRRDSPGRSFTAELERKVPVTVRCNAGLVTAIKAIQKAYTGPDGPVPIFFDLKGRGEADASLLKNVVLSVEDVPLREVLKMALDQVGLTYRVEDGRIVIGEVTADPASAHGQ